LQQSTQEAEEALSQGLDALNQSLSETITSDSLSNPPNMANYMGQMALAMNKLSTLESFVRQVCFLCFHKFIFYQHLILMFCILPTTYNVLHFLIKSHLHYYYYYFWFV